MKPSAVLLIDLENFYCSREDYCRSSPPTSYDRVRFAYDLDKLLVFARAMADSLPFTVRRAYANFNAARYTGGAPPMHYLRHIPDELMRQGVEPVQVFRLSQSGSKNAADMRMAMDATALISSAGNVEHFVLVTGDADFIPVILELKRHGYSVSVIGVTGATNALIQRFVDNFELFEDLLAAEEVEARSGELANAADNIAPVVAAIHRLLARTRPLRFAAVKPLLSKELGHAFDPSVFGCDTTGEFLRKYQNELGVAIRSTQHDQEIDLPSSAPTSNGPSGSSGVKITPRPPARQPDKQSAKCSAANECESHSCEQYYELLTGRGQAASAFASVRVHAVPWPVLVWGCEAMVSLLAPPTGSPTHTTTLQPKLMKAADGVPVEDIVKHLRMFYPILRAGLPVQSTDGVYSLPSGITGEQIRRSVLRYVGYVLTARLSENNIAGEICPETLAAFFNATGSELEQAVVEIRAALIQTTLQAPSSSHAPTKTCAEEIHTPAGYMKLLKAGGAKGSETESFKILPVPWPSIQLVCADVFPLLCPQCGGGSMPRDMLTMRLADLGKEQGIDRYEQHIRRVLGMLRIAGDVIEANGTVAISPEIATAQDLRNRTLVFLLQLLQLRLEERQQYDPIRPHTFAMALEAGLLTDAIVEEIKPVIAWLYEEVVSVLPADQGEPLELAQVAESVVSPPANEPVLSNSEPEWQPPAESGTPLIAESTQEDSPATGSDVVDVAALTSEAVAAAASAIQRDLPIKRKSPDDNRDDDVLITIPVPDWLPDDDPLRSSISPTSPNVHSDQPTPMSGTRLIPTASLTVPTSQAIAKINVAHGAIQPPPLPQFPPPLPPETV